MAQKVPSWERDPRTLALVEALENALRMIEWAIKEKGFDPPPGSDAEVQARLILAKEAVRKGGDEQR